MRAVIKSWLPSLAAVAMMLNACSGRSVQTEPVEAPNAAQSAEQTVRDYFEHLDSGSYERGAALYGGSLESLRQNNPEIDPQNPAALFESACRLQLRCLSVKTVIGFEEISQGEFVFQIEFAGPPGETFVLGPCCGASEEEMPPVSVFEVRVRRTAAGDFKVLALPLYVP